jgi:putative acetyltransferase
MSLETGAAAFFKPAHTLYAAHGFSRCGPFGTDQEDPNSVFMTREL